MELQELRDYLTNEDNEEVMEFIKYPRKGVKETSVGNFEGVDEDGVHEDGREFGIIFKFQDRLFRVPCCFYSSWDSTDYDFHNLNEVEALEKTITVYNTKKGSYQAK